MARQTAEDMVNEVRDNIGGETTETMSDARILRFLNKSYLQVASDLRPDQLRVRQPTAVTTSDGTAAYELGDADILAIEVATDTTNNLELRPMNKRKYEKFTQGDYTTYTGQPQYWFISGVGSNNRFEVTLWPTPAGTYTLYFYYWKKPTELVLTPSATSPITPEQWDDVIVSLATYRAFRNMGNIDDARKWNRMARDDASANKKTTYHPSVVPTTPSSLIGLALRDVD